MDIHLLHKTCDAEGGFGYKANSKKPEYFGRIDCHPLALQGTWKSNYVGQ